jgi:hypothetical protein
MGSLSTSMSFVMPAHALQPLPAPGATGTPSAFSWRRFRDVLLRRVVGVGIEVFSVRLAAGQELQLHDVAGWTVVCRSGTVWITQEADSRDLFLKDGEGFALDRDGLAIVRACTNALLSIRAPPAGEQRAARSAGRTAAARSSPRTTIRRNWCGYGRCIRNAVLGTIPASYRRAGLL